MQKYPDFLHLLDTWKTKLFDAQKPRGATLVKWLNTLLGGHRRRNPPCNAEDNLCAEHFVIEDWFGGY